MIEELNEEDQIELKRFEYKYIRIYTKSRVDKDFEKFENLRYHKSIKLYIKLIQFLDWKQMLIHMVNTRTRRLFINLFVKDKFKKFREYIKESNDILISKETLKYKVKKNGSV